MDFIEILHQYKDIVFRIVYMNINDFHKSEDITQEIFTKVYKSLHKFRGDSTIYTWIYSISMNTIRTYVKKDTAYKNMLSLDEIDEVADIGWNEEALIDALQNRSIVELIYKLPFIYKEVSALYYCEDIKVEQIAAILKEPVGTIKSKLHRGRNMLKAMILEEGIIDG